VLGVKRQRPVPDGILGASLQGVAIRLVHERADDTAAVAQLVERAHGRADLLAAQSAAWQSSVGDPMCTAGSVAAAAAARLLDLAAAAATAGDRG
jgi:hypothetical protein